MDIQEYWEKALKHTEIIRPRVQPLQTFGDTHLPYIFLTESTLNLGDTVVRKGEVLVERPVLLLPPNIPQFEGFDFDKERQVHHDLLTNFLLLRGVRFPSLRYNNKTLSLDLHEGKLTQAIQSYSEQLQKEENLSTGLLTGPEDSWQFSILIFICTQVMRSADRDIRQLLDEFKRKEKN